MKQKPSLTIDDARRIGAAAAAAAQQLGIAMTIAIVDDGGHLLWLERLDARVSTLSVAISKAKSSALMRAPTAALEQRIATSPQLLALESIPLQGGLPILVDGDCVGAIGVSGGTGEQDEAVGHAGLTRL
jgi:glc operon protein GlcG